MIWKNKTHELDQAADQLLKNSERWRHIYIFGAGLIGSRIMLTLRKYGIFAGFIDNDVNKQMKGYKGAKVYSLNEYMSTQNGFVVIAADSCNIGMIKRQLEDAHLTEEQEFASYEDFTDRIFPVISLYLFDKLFVNITQISLTERCSLRCKKCAHGCFMVDNKKSEDLSIEKVYKSADCFFDKVDYVNEFVLIGGEPLLYQQLPLAIRYIGTRYRKQIGVFSITTNGTILPNQETLKLCTEYDVLFRISNYSMTLPGLKDAYIRMTDLLDKSGIRYELGKEEKEWMDYGFDYVNRNGSPEELINVFDTCKTPCREIRENRFYFCVMARSVSENMGMHVGKDDYLDLDSLNSESYKRELLEFNLGYSEKGYLDMCNYCHGAEAVQFPIPAAEQAKH